MVKFIGLDKSLLAPFSVLTEAINNNGAVNSSLSYIYHIFWNAEKKSQFFRVCSQLARRYGTFLG